MTGTLPRPGTPTARRAGTPPAPLTEAGIARLAEDAARRAPAASGPVATVRVDGTAVRVDLDLVVDHGAHLPTVGRAVRRRVAAGIVARTGLTVEAVTVTVVQLRLPGASPAPAAAACDGHRGNDAGRPGPDDRLDRPGLPRTDGRLRTARPDGAPPGPDGREAT